jgi:molybdopterin converting factor subunit 1
MLDSGMLTITVLFFGPAKDAAGGGNTTLSFSAFATVRDVRLRLVERSPEMAGLLATSRIARNRSFAADDEPLADGDELAVIPPVSGG